MRTLKMLVVLGVLTTAGSGCRLFHDREPSHSYYAPPPQVVLPAPAASGDALTTPARGE